MIVGVLTTCHKQYTWDRSIGVFLFNRTTLQVFVTYLTGSLYVHHLWFYKHQHDNRVRSRLFVAGQRWWFQWRFWWPAPFPPTRQRIFKPAFTAAMDRAWDQWRSDATRLATSFSRCNPMWFISMGLRQGLGLCSSSSRKYPGTEGTNQNRHWNHHRWPATNSLERTRLSCWCL